MSSLTIAIQIILMFFVLVTIHEWGHFYFAKRAGILVREFAIGFGPKLFTYTKGETRYTLRLLPIGGFVRMAGEDPELVDINEGQTIAVSIRDQQVEKLYLDQLDQRKDVVQGTVQRIDLEHKLEVVLDVDGETIPYNVHPQALLIARGKETQIAPWDRQFGSKTVGQRSLTIAAGPIMNFLLAAVLFLIFMLMAGVVDGVKLEQIDPNRPAGQAGLQSGDVVLSVNDTPIGTDSTKLMELIQASPGQSMEFTVLRNESEVKLNVTPENVDGTGLIGVAITPLMRSASFPEAITGTGDMLVNSTKQILIGFRMLVTGQFKLDDLGGPVRIVEVTSDYASHGIDMFIGWAGLLSLYLALFNLLPFPALDGSRLVFLGLEALRGKPVDPNRESMVHFIGFAMLMLLIIAVTYNDILRLIKG